MRKVTIYQYPKCGTSRKAVKWLQEHDVEMDSIPIVESPPSAEQLAEFVRKSGLDIKKFFNTSGEVYKEMNLKDRLPELSDEQKIGLLAANGKLIKRPIVTDGNRVTVGFNEEQFEEIWGG
ncbi:arsenate reductase family protein [Ferviditalea candida]|uniref:Arsenate reductase family protein n=1 Tax=Ferviditalea candida TaxID=3108399 RepID=A0ABU5ZFX5_9BACL|nr:arsenate reductase family protein [Paenibacillaceae bacterium T2]